MATNRTVLEFVQDILGYLEADIVNDINDTEESELVLTALRNTFYDIADEFEFPHKYENFQLTPSGTTDMPTHMTLPNGISSIDGVLYDKLDSATDPTNYETVWRKEPKEFMQLINNRDSSDSTVDKITDTSGVTFLILNDRNPTYWTSFDDETMVFDSYDSSLDSWLQNSKTWITGWRRPTFENKNNHKPDIPQYLEQYFFNEACSLAFVNYNQTANSKVEQRAQRARRASLNTWKRTSRHDVKTPHYGRK